MGCILLILGIIAAVVGGTLVYNGWYAAPQEWGMIGGGVVLVIIGFVLAGVLFFGDGLDL